MYTVPTLSPMPLIKIAYIDINTKYYLWNISSFKATTKPHTKNSISFWQIDHIKWDIKGYTLPKLFSQFQNKMA